MDEILFNTTIILEEEKLRKSIYSKEKIHKHLDKMFKVVGMERDGNTFKNGTLAEVGAVTMELVKTEWFVPLVKEWTLDEMDGDTVLSTENIFESRSLRRRFFDKYGL